MWLSYQDLNETFGILISQLLIQNLDFWKKEKKIIITIIVVVVIIMKKKKKSRMNTLPRTKQDVVAVNMDDATNNIN